MRRGTGTARCSAWATVAQLPPLPIFAGDLAKLTIVPGKKRLKAVVLVDNIPLVSARTNDAGVSSIFAEQAEPWFRAGDALVGLSVHGGLGKGKAGLWSQNLLRAVALAKERTTGVIGFPASTAALSTKWPTFAA